MARGETPRDRARIYRRQAYERQRGKCYYCRRRIDPSAVTADHAVPKSRGGLSTKENIVAACLDCNQKKRDMSAVEFRVLQIVAGMGVNECY
jgi:5-methylcytosine-specific restriction protein A